MADDDLPTAADDAGHTRRLKKLLSPDSEQSRRFVEAARELGCDDSEERFVETVRKLAKAGPQHRPARRPAKGKG